MDLPSVFVGRSFDVDIVFGALQQAHPTHDCDWSVFSCFSFLEEDLRILPAHATAKLSGFTTFVCLHTLLGVDGVHRVACLKGPLQEDSRGTSRQILHTTAIGTFYKQKRFHPDDYF